MHYPGRAETAGPRHHLRYILPIIFAFVIGTAAHAQQLRILAPNGGENLVVGTTVQIRWIEQGLTGTTQLEFTVDSGAVWQLIDSVPAKAGVDSLAWTVPNDTTHRALVRLTNGDRTSKSARLFNIVLTPVPVLRVIYPNGNELLEYDSTVKVRRPADNVSGQLDPHYSIDSGGTWKPIATVASHAGADSLVRVVPHDSTTRAFVRVRTADSAVKDASNRTFSIRAAVKPQITLRCPNGGEVFKQDSMVYIRWTGANLTGRVRVYWSDNNGAAWAVLDSVTARAGADSPAWSVPHFVITGAMIRIDTRSNQVASTSNGAFTIVPKDASGVGNEADERADRAMLIGCFPNPSGAATSVRWVQTRPGTAVIRVFDRNGALALSAEAGPREAGAQAMTIATAELPVGVYPFELRVDGMRLHGSLTVVR